MIGLVFVAGPATAAGAFDDDDGNVHEDAIEAIVAAGITKGCNPPANDRYCPDGVVTRGQMAAFLTRLLDLPSGQKDRFTDDDGSVFESDINALGKAGISQGCNPPANTAFCPDRAVTRGEMAAFLVRALDLDPTNGDYFADDAASVFEADINALARVGVSRGCNPPENTRFCPDSPVQRDQMATFMHRASTIVTTGTTSTTRPKATTTTTPGATTSTTAPQVGTGAFIEQDGVAVMEVESVPTASGWSRQTSVSGYTGSAYLYRTGSHTTQTGQGTLTYRIEIGDPGTYAVTIRARRDRAAGENVENGQRNDVFVKMDSDEWWKATTHASFGTWGWIDKKTVAHATFEPLVWNLDAGVHTLLVSGRSQYVKIDRVHVYRVPEGLSLSEIRELNPPTGTPESPRTP